MKAIQLAEFFAFQTLEKSRTSWGYIGAATLVQFHQKLDENTYKLRAD